MRRCTISGTAAQSERPTSEWTSNKESLLFTLLVLWSGLMTFLIPVSGEIHDYEAYVSMWTNIIAGGDPWQTEGIPVNAYGPLHNVFSLVAVQQSVLPKLIFGLSFLAINSVLFLNIVRTRPPAKVLVVYAVLIPINYLVIGVVFVFGNNDALVAALIGFAIIARLRGHLVSAGILIGSAILLKYYPALLLPFLALDVRRIKWPIIITAGVTTLVGLMLTYITWGPSFASAFLFGAGRGASVLSVIAHLDFLGAPDSFILPALRFNSLIVLFAVGSIFLLAWWRKFGWLESMSLAMLTMVVTYKVGHQQFLLPWIVILVALLWLRSKPQWGLVLVSLPLVFALSIYQAVFEQYWRAGVFWEESASVVREQMGIPFFSLGLATIIGGIAILWRDPPRVDSTDECEEKHGSRLTSCG